MHDEYQADIDAREAKRARPPSPPEWQAVPTPKKSGYTRQDYEDLAEIVRELKSSAEYCDRPGIALLENALEIYATQRQ